MDEAVIDVWLKMKRHIFYKVAYKRIKEIWKKLEKEILESYKSSKTGEETVRIFILKYGIEKIGKKMSHVLH
jgi:hypothetical protein